SHPSRTNRVWHDTSYGGSLSDPVCQLINAFRHVGPSEATCVTQVSAAARAQTRSFRNSRNRASRSSSESRRAKTLFGGTMRVLRSRRNGRSTTRCVSGDNDGQSCANLQRGEHDSH